MKLDYNEILRIENHRRELERVMSDVMDNIIEAEKRVYTDNVDALEDGFVDNPYPREYFFANLDAGYYYDGEFNYSASPDSVALTQDKEFSDGDYACSINRRIPYEVFEYETPEQFYDYVFARYCEAQAERRQERAERQAERQREQTLLEATEAKRRFTQYQLLKAEFENA